MVVSIKDSLKLVAVGIVCFCAVFVCTFMLNFYLDVIPLKGDVPAEMSALFDAQLVMAQFTSAITGGFFAAIAFVMIVFYIKLYIDGHIKQLGILKAMGYSESRIALGFWVFGLSVFAGCALGFCVGWTAMPAIYKTLTLDGLNVKPEFHAILLVCLVVLPIVFFSLVSCSYAYFALKRPVCKMLGGEKDLRDKKERCGKDKNRSFLAEMRAKTLSSKKLLVFFVAFSCFCFSAMVQMGLSMEGLADGAMGLMILLIGVVLSVVGMIMAVTSLLGANIKNISVMKAFGYSLKECSLAVLAGYLPFAAIGFAVGTVYQYGLLMLMVNVIFKEVGQVAEYSFNVPVFFITLAVFVAAYALTMTVCIMKFKKISVNKVVQEN